MDKIQDDDLMLVSRGGTNYKIKGSDVKGSLGGGSEGIIKRIAKGDISAGDAVLLNPDDTVSSVSGEDSGFTQLAQVSHTPDIRDRYADRYSICYAGNNRYFAISTGNDRIPEYYIYYFDEATNQFTITKLPLVDSSKKSKYVYCHQLKEDVVLGIFHDDYNLNARVFHLTSNTTAEYGSLKTNIDTNARNDTRVASTPDSNVFMFSVNNPTSGQRGYVYTYDESNWNLTKKGSQTISQNTSSFGYREDQTFTWDETLQKFIWTYRRSNDVKRYMDLISFDDAGVITQFAKNYQDALVLDVTQTNCSKPLYDAETNAYAVVVYPYLVNSVTSTATSLYFKITDNGSNSYSLERYGLTNFFTEERSFTVDSNDISISSTSPNSSILANWDAENTYLYQMFTINPLFPEKSRVKVLDGKQLSIWATADDKNRTLVVTQEQYDISPAPLVLSMYKVGSLDSNLFEGDFLGFSQGNYSDGTQATIDSHLAINTFQSGLTGGLRYNVESDGTLNTIEDATTFSKPAGKAESSTSIKVLLN